MGNTSPCLMSSTCARILLAATATTGKRRISCTHGSTTILIVAMGLLTSSSPCLVLSTTGQISFVWWMNVRWRSLAGRVSTLWTSLELRRLCVSTPALCRSFPDPFAQVVADCGCWCVWHQALLGQVWVCTFQRSDTRASFGYLWQPGHAQSNAWKST